MSAQTDFLRQHAVQNVWCAPGQDSQYIFELPRISSVGGALRVTSVAGYPLDLPDTFSRWQIFQIGGIPPSAFGLLTRPYAWVNAAVQANENNTVVRLFSNTGVVCGLGDVFYRYTQAGNLLVVARMHNRTPINWNTATIFLQVYTNAYWKTADGVANTTGFEVEAALLETSNQISSFQTLYSAAQAVAEFPYQLSFWHNGLKKDFANTTLSVGDSVFFELDGSIKKRIEFTIGSLPSFDSTLDHTRKYLIHPPKDGTSTTIDYYDDIEIFLIGNDASKSGILYPRVAFEDVRQLTHRDYSIVVSDVVFLAAGLRQFGGGEQPSQKVQLVVRKSGYTRALIEEGSFIQELYKLDDVLIGRALTGIDATVPFWRAAALEASSYPALMRAPDVSDVSYPLVEAAYGYYAMAKALAMTPSVVTNPGNNGFVVVPYLLMYGCTAYEYDVNGHLLGWHHHYVGDRYFTHDVACTKVELLAGLGGTTLDEVHGVTSAQLRQDCNWRVYLRQQVGGSIQQAFVDVTGTNKYTINSNGDFTWVNGSITDYPTLRSDRRFFAADYELDVTDGRIAVTLTTMQRHGNNTLNQPIGIPLGQIDAIFNGYSLIRGIHYFYKNGQLVVTAREYVDQTPGVKQKLHVRMYGFCRSDGSLYPEGDFGFIEHGVLSNNNRFDVRDGRITRVVVDGALHTLDELVFSESSNQVAPLSPTNGKPYLVKDIFVPLKPFTEPDTWALIEQARANTKTVSDYMTLKMPQPTRGPVQAVQRKHELVSPFLAKMLYDLIYGRMGLPAKDTFTRQEVIELCKPYEFLLETDPVSQDLNPAYVVIQPHTKLTPVGVTPKQWQFLNQVVQIYAAGKVDLNNSLSINN